MELFGSVSRSSRIPADGRAVVVGGTRHDHVAELDFVGRRHDGQVGDAPHVAQIVAAVVGRPVVSDKAAAVQHHSDGQVLDGHVVDDLVVSALHERRVDADKGLEALAGHSGSHRHGVLLGNSHVKGSLGKPAPENVHSGPAGHGGGNSDDAAVLDGGVDEGVGKDGGKARLAGLALVLGAGAEVELADAVHSVAGGFGGRVSVSLDGLDVQQDGLVVGGVPELFENGNEVVEVVAVDGSDVVESQFLKEGSSRDQPAGVFVDALVDALDVLRQELVEGFGKVSKVLKGLGDQ